MANKTVLEELDGKIMLLLEQYEALQEENNLLKETLEASRETESQLRQEIRQLKEEDELKDVELEEIAGRIGRYFPSDKTTVVS